MPQALPTRDRLINSARYLFWERGYAGTSMADLLAHADVNSGSFYHFFESKEALLREVLEGYLHALRHMVVDPAFAQTEEPVERIFGILAGYRERILQTECRYGCPLGRLALEIDPENRPAHKLIAENFGGWITAVRECIDQIKHRLPKNTDPDALATYVLGRPIRSRSQTTPSALPTTSDFTQITLQKTKDTLRPHNQSFAFTEKPKDAKTEN
jgi:TetR/AcrR family transcriptional repressor of nem operon